MSCGVVSRVVGRRLSLNRPQSIPSIRRESDAAPASPPARLNTKVHPRLVFVVVTVVVTVVVVVVQLLLL